MKGSKQLDGTSRNAEERVTEHTAKARTRLASDLRNGVDRGRELHMHLTADNVGQALGITTMPQQSTMRSQEHFSSDPSQT